MSRAVKAGEVWSTFTFDGIDCADLGVYAISNSSTYTTNLEPTFTDKKTNVTAYDGQYYYGTQITGQKFTFNMFAENLSLKELNRLRAWLNPRHIGKLITSDEPYKFYYVKPTSVSSLSNIPLTNIQTSADSILHIYTEGDLVYTGKFSITFETVGTAYGYGMSYYRDDFIYDAAEKYGENYYYDVSGFLYKDMCPTATWEIESNAIWQPIPLYNPGSVEGKPTYRIIHEGTFTRGSKIELRNNTLGTATIIDVGDLSGNLTINTLEQTIVDAQGTIYYGRFEGPNLSISPYESVIELPNTYADDEDNYNFIEHATFSVVGDKVQIDPKIFVVSPDVIGHYFCTNNNGGIKIIGVDEDNNMLILEKNNPDNILSAVVKDGEITRPAGIEYTYKEVNNIMPESGNRNEVCVVNGVWYIYTTEWKETNLFTSKEEFRNIYGDYVSIYRTVGGTIVKLDDIIIRTGYRLGDVSVGAFTLSAELQPRYL